MKHILLITILVFALPSLVLSQTTGKKDEVQEHKTSSLEHDVMKLEQELSELTKRHDAAALKQILADDFSFIGGFGVLRDRENYLAMIANVPYQSYTKEDLKVRVYGNTAVSTGPITEKYENSPDIRYRFTNVYVKQNGRWRQVAMHLTSIAQQQ